MEGLSVHYTQNRSNLPDGPGHAALTLDPVREALNNSITQVGSGQPEQGNVTSFQALDAQCIGVNVPTLAGPMARMGRQIGCAIFETAALRGPSPVSLYTAPTSQPLGGMLKPVAPGFIRVTGQDRPLRSC